MPKPHITQEILMRAFDYDPDTGVFRWRTAPFSRLAGRVAGYRDKDGYRRLATNGVRSIAAHRAAWLYVYGEWPAGMLDHIDGNRLNNRINNLRVATSSQNQANSRVRLNSSGYKGVTWHAQAKRWQAQIKDQTGCRYLGLYETPELAHAAYVAAAHELFGEFARAA